MYKKSRVYLTEQAIDSLKHGCHVHVLPPSAPQYAHSAVYRYCQSVSGHTNANSNSLLEAALAAVKKYRDSLPKYPPHIPKMEYKEHYTVEHFAVDGVEHNFDAGSLEEAREIVLTNLDPTKWWQIFKGGNLVGDVKPHRSVPTHEVTASTETLQTIGDDIVLKVEPAYLLYHLYKKIDKLIDDITGENLRQVSKTLHELLGRRLDIIEGQVRDPEVRSNIFGEYGKEMYQSGIFNLLGIDYIENATSSAYAGVCVLYIVKFRRGIA